MGNNLVEVLESVDEVVGEMFEYIDDEKIVSIDKIVMKYENTSVRCVLVCRGIDDKCRYITLRRDVDGDLGGDDC